MNTSEILKALAPEFVALDEWAKIQRNSSERVLAAKVQELFDAYAQALLKLGEVEKVKNAAYSERNQCVAALARTLLTLGFNVGRAIHPIEDTEWESDWRNILYIDLPTGQVSWHFHDSEAHLIERFPEYDEPWDGHSTRDKYNRLKPFPIEFWEMAEVDDFPKPIKLAEREWRPIETADEQAKNGERLLFWVVHPNLSVCPPEERHLWQGACAGRWSDHNGGGWIWHGLSGTVTHWQPLPAPPGESSSQISSQITAESSQITTLQEKLERAKEALSRIENLAEGAKDFIPGVSRPADFCDAQALKLFVAEEARAALDELEDRK